MPASVPRLFRLLFFELDLMAGVVGATVAEKDRRGKTMVLPPTGAMKPKEASPGGGTAGSACCRTSELQKATPR